MQNANDYLFKLHWLSPIFTPKTQNIDNDLKWCIIQSTNAYCSELHSKFISDCRTIYKQEGISVEGQPSPLADSPHLITRRHSSRMHTIHSSGYGGGGYPSMHWAEGCVSQHALGRRVCIPACTGQGGMYPTMHWARGCVSHHALGGGCLPGGAQCMLGYTSPC